MAGTPAFDIQTCIQSMSELRTTTINSNAKRVVTTQETIKKKLGAIPDTPEKEVEDNFDTLAIYSKVAEEWQIQTLITHNIVPRENHNCIDKDATCHAVDVTVTVYYSITKTGMERRKEQQLKDSLKRIDNGEHIYHSDNGEPPRKKMIVLDPNDERIKAGEDTKKRKRGGAAKQQKTTKNKWAPLKQSCWKCCRCTHNLVYRQYTTSPTVCEMIAGNDIIIPRTLSTGQTLLPGEADGTVTMSSRLHMPGLMKGIYMPHVLPASSASTAQETQHRGRLVIPFFIQNTNAVRKVDEIKSSESSINILLPKLTGLSILTSDTIPAKHKFLEASTSLTEEVPGRHGKERNVGAIVKGRGRRKRATSLATLTMNSHSISANIASMENTTRSGSDKEPMSLNTIYGIMSQKDWKEMLDRLRLVECEDGRVENEQGESINLGREEVCHCECCTKRKNKQTEEKTKKEHGDNFYASTNIRKKPRRNPETSSSTSLFLKSSMDNPVMIRGDEDDDQEERKCCSCSCTQDIYTCPLVRPTVTSSEVRPDKRQKTVNTTITTGDDGDVEEDDVSILHVCVEETNGTSRACFGGSIRSHKDFMYDKMTRPNWVSSSNMRKFTLKDGFFCNETGLFHICLPGRCTFSTEKSGWSKETRSDVVCPFSSKVLNADMFVDPFWRLPGNISSHTTPHGFSAEELSHGKMTLANLGRGSGGRGSGGRNGRNEERYWNNPKIPPGSRRDWTNTIDGIRELLEDPLVDSDTLRRNLTENYLPESGGYAEYMAVAMTHVAILFSSNRFDSDISETRKIVALTTRNVMKVTSQIAKQHITFFRERMEKGFSRIFEDHIVVNDDLMKTWQEVVAKKKQEEIDRGVAAGRISQAAAFRSRQQCENGPSLSGVVNGDTNAALPIELIDGVIKGKWHDHDNVRVEADKIMHPAFLDEEKGSAGVPYALKDAICYDEGAPPEVLRTSFARPDIEPNDFISQLKKVPQLGKLAPNISPQHISDLREHYPSVYKSIVYPPNVYASSKDLLSLRVMQIHDMKKKPWPVVLAMSGKNRARFIEAYAKQAIQLWCLIRRHTHLGQTKPNMFPFPYFVITAMYIFRNGVTLPGRVFSSDKKEVILEKDPVLVEILPREGSSYMVNFREPVMQIERNIHKAIIDAVVNYDTPPDWFDFMKTEVENQPTDLFVPLRKSGSRNLHNSANNSNNN